MMERQIAVEMQEALASMSLVGHESYLKSPRVFIRASALGSRDSDAWARPERKHIGDVPRDISCQVWRRPNSRVAGKVALHFRFTVLEWGRGKFDSVLFTEK